MVVPIQILVAGALLAAWLWVLGRPVMAGPAEQSGADEPGRGALDRSARPASRGAGWLVARWRQHPLAYRRRQLLLATMFAAFGSFFLAIALRGRFVYLFALMMVVLVTHLAVASRVGARLVALERAQRIAAARQRLKAEQRSVRAPSVRHRLDRDAERDAEVPPAGDLAPPTPDVTDEPRPSPFHVAAELASLLEGAGDEEVSHDATRSFVNELIEHEWGPSGRETVVAEQEPLATAVELPDDPPVPEAEPASEAELASEVGLDPEPEVTSEVAPSPHPGTRPPRRSKSDAIFTRAAKDERPRSRRKAQPIHIHSHLDDVGEETPGRRAVNDR